MTDDTPKVTAPTARILSRTIRPPNQVDARESLVVSWINGRRRASLFALVGLLLVIMIAPLTARRATDLLWYQEIGFQRVFLLKIAAQWALGLTAGIGSLLVLYVNGRVALRRMELEEVPAFDHFRSGPRSRIAFLTRLATILATPASILFAILVAILAAAEWRTVVQFIYRSPFGVVDPVFGRDVAYYVFTLPISEGVIDFTGLDTAGAADRDPDLHRAR